MNKLFCCYLLTPVNAKWLNHTYIGFTNNPIRRLRQHNREVKGGAKKTGKKLPWTMVLLVHGFTTKRAALYFEWAWQRPKLARPMKDIMPTIKRAGPQHLLKAKIRHMYEMLNVPPWSRFPLTVRWLTNNYQELKQNCPPLPVHMKEETGSAEDLMKNYVDAAPEEEEVNEAEEDLDDAEVEKLMNELEHDPQIVDLTDEPTVDTSIEAINRDIAIARENIYKSIIQHCSICKQEIEKDKCITCPTKSCTLSAHLCCLSTELLKKEPTDLIPTSGSCPQCSKPITWPDVIARKRKREPKDKNKENNVENTNTPIKKTKKAYKKVKKS
jgi:structure-specific endonuclease subunit SLX1